MNIPETKACFNMLCRMAMLDHIAAHSIRVCQVAELICDQLRDAGVYLNRPLITASALLHDITKTRSFETKENHAETGEQYLRDLGYPEVGDIVGQHVRMKVYTEDGTPTEAEVVNYADKRVLHDRIVPLDDRMSYIVERYGGGKDDLFEKLQWLWQRTIALEERLFSFMNFPPESLNDRILESDFDVLVAGFNELKQNSD